MDRATPPDGPAAGTTASTGTLAIQAVSSLGTHPSPTTTLLFAHVDGDTTLDGEPRNAARPAPRHAGGRSAERPR